MRRARHLTLEQADRIFRPPFDRALAISILRAKAGASDRVTISPEFALELATALEKDAPNG